MYHPDGPTFWELARQALSSTTRGYDLLAPKFDVTPFRTPDGISQKERRLRLRELEAAAGARSVLRHGRDARMAASGLGRARREPRDVEDLSPETPGP